MDQERKSRVEYVRDQFCKRLATAAGDLVERQMLTERALLSLLNALTVDVPAQEQTPAPPAAAPSDVTAREHLDPRGDHRAPFYPLAFFEHGMTHMLLKEGIIIWSTPEKPHVEIGHDVQTGAIVAIRIGGNLMKGKHAPAAAALKKAMTSS